MDPMIGSLIIFFIVYVLIAFEIVDKTVAAVLGAAAVIMLHYVPYEHALGAIDLNVIFLLTGMMIIMHIMSQTGVFEWMAVVIAQRARGNGIAILLMFFAATAVISAFLDNVTTVILIAPITILICAILEIPAIPFLILEAIASNIGGTATLIGDPPNVLIGSRVGLTFNEFIVNLSPIVLVMLAVALPCVYFAFRRPMTAAPAARLRIMSAKPEKAILDPLMLRRSFLVFAVVLAGFFLSHSLHIEPGIIALAGALAMCLVCRVNIHSALEKVEWNSIFFFIGLFMLIGSLEYNGVFKSVGEFIIELTQGNFILTLVTILWFAGIASAIVDNIPLVIAMIPLVQIIIPSFAEQMGVSGSPELMHTTVAGPLYWSLALGACLGGNGTLIGASANVIIAQIGQKNNLPITFMGFTRIGLPMMIMTLIISTVYLFLRYHYFA